MKTISIISPCFQEQDNVRECYEAVKTVFELHLPEYNYEHIFADNASSDNTVNLLKAIAAEDNRVKLIVNARNYGPFRSTFNALKSAQGDAVLVMLPVDLQDPPMLIPTFVYHWERGAKIVRGLRVQREEGVCFRKLRAIYYRVVRSIADIHIPVDTAEFQLIDKQILNYLVQSNDAYPYIRGMIANCGYRDSTVEVPYTWERRKQGLSKNKWYHLFDQGMNGIISFTTVPLRVSTLIGFGIALLSVLYAIIQLIINLMAPGPLAAPGIPTLIVAIFFFSGVQLFFIGLMGEYIGVIHNQVRRGSAVIEREKINFNHSTAKPMD